MARGCTNGSEQTERNSMKRVQKIGISLLILGTVVFSATRAFIAGMGIRRYFAASRITSTDKDSPRGAGRLGAPAESLPETGHLIRLDQAPDQVSWPRPTGDPPGAAAKLIGPFLSNGLPRVIADTVQSARWRFSLWLGERIDREEARRHGFFHDPVLVRRPERILMRLKRHSLRPGDPILFRILDTDDPEQIARASSSTIYFGKAYLELAPSDDELMFVAAHELAHVEMGHTFSKAADETSFKFRRLLHSIQVHVASSILQSDRSAQKDHFGWEPTNRQRKEELKKKEDARSRERKADLWGARIALAAGAAPRGIKETLDRFQVSRERRYKSWGIPMQEAELDTRELTHPLPLTRLRYLEQVFGPEFWNTPHSPK